MSKKRKSVRRICGIVAILAFLMVLGAAGAIECSAIAPEIGFRRVGIYMAIFGACTRVLWG